MRIVVAQDTDRVHVAARGSRQRAHETHESKVLFNQALEYASRSRWREAMKSLEDALQISPRNAGYLSHYGVAVAAELEDYPSAVKLCERAIRLDPRNPVVHVNLGRVYRMMGENKSAHDAFISGWNADRKHPAPAAELTRMGVRRPPVLPFLPRSHWLNVRLGILRARLTRR
jgi:tetratricopeptide (TPR) repeat protein